MQMCVCGMWLVECEEMHAYMYIIRVFVLAYVLYRFAFKLASMVGMTCCMYV